MTTEQLKAWLLEYMPLKLETENRREHLKRLNVDATNRLHRKALAHLSQQITEAPQHE